MCFCSVMYCYDIRQACFPRAGLDKATAKRVLQAWEASGASSPDELRKLLVKRSVQSAGAVLIQTLLDAGEPWLMQDSKKTPPGIIEAARDHSSPRVRWETVPDELWKPCPADQGADGGWHANKGFSEGVVEQVGPSCPWRVTCTLTGMCRERA